MGSCDFRHFVKRNTKQVGTKNRVVGRTTYIEADYGPWPNAREAFDHATQEAAYEHGHGGYTGTIAEKRGRGFIMIATVDTRDEAREMANKLIDRSDPRIDDKWGPAGCIEVRGDDGGWLFFGWASD